MSIAAAYDAIELAAEAEAERQSQDGHWRALLVRSDVLLDQAERANLHDEDLPPHFLVGFAELVADVDPALLAPLAGSLTGRAVRIAMAARAWSVHRLAQRARVRDDSVRRMAASSTSDNHSAAKVCEMLAAMPALPIAKARRQPLPPGPLLDALFDLQAFLFRRIAESAGHVVVNDDASPSGDDVVALRDACAWLAARGGIVHVDATAPWFDEVVDALQDHQAVLASNATMYKLADRWRERLAALENGGDSQDG